MRTARKQQCSRVLRNTFGVSGFRPGQEQAADALLDGRDLLCILPRQKPLLAASSANDG